MSILNCDVECFVGEPGENNLGVVPIDTSDGEQYTPFIQSISDGVNISLIAPLYYQGVLFVYWKIINNNGQTTFNYDNELIYAVTEELEIRAVYVRQSLFTTVETIVGAVVPMFESELTCNVELSVI